MNLISVSKAIENAGVQNPDFINLTWVIDDKTIKMDATTGIMNAGFVERARGLTASARTTASLGSRTEPGDAIARTM